MGDIIEFTKRGNVKINDVKFKAQKPNRPDGCTGCAFYTGPDERNCMGFPCTPARRPDTFRLPGQHVIFVKVAA